MKAPHCFLTAIAVAVFAIAAAPAQASLVTFNFADPGADVPEGTLGTDWVACDSSGEDRCAGELEFEKSGVTVTASVFASDSEDDPGIIQDLRPDDGGLGIVDSFDDGGHGGNDNVSEGETILLTFGPSVFLMSVGFEDNHGSSLTFDDFLFSTNGVNYTSYALASSVDFGGLAGSTFYFQHAGDRADDFYISNVVVDPVPEPSTVLLMGAGILGLVRRARGRRH